MSGNWLFAAELLITLGVVFGIGIWQLRSLRRLKEEREAAARRDAEARDDPARGPSEPPAR